MRIRLRWVSALITVLTIFNSCDKNNTIPPSEPENKGQLTVQLPANLSSTAENAYNSLAWDSSDKPALVQIAEDQTFMISNPRLVSCGEDGGAKMIFEFPKSQEEHRFCFIKTGLNTPVFGQNPALNAWPVNLPAEQIPSPNTIDPQADVLVSNITFSLSQDFLSKNYLDLQLKRKNAVAKLILKGIPADYELSEFVITAPVNLNGKRNINLTNGVLEKSYGNSTLTLKFNDKTKSLKDKDGNRVTWASFWPCVLDTYQASLKANDSEGKSHEFKAKVNVFAPSVLLEAQCFTEWTFEMYDVLEKPVLPPTPEGPKEVIHGQNGPTLELYKKIKAYQDNGISMVEDWWTHYLGYKGVLIHEAKLIQYGTPVHMWIVEADPKLVGFALGTPYDSNQVPAPTKQNVSGQCRDAEKVGKKVIAAINGDAWGARGKLYTYGVMFKDGVCLKNWAVEACDIANTDTFYTLDDGTAAIADQNEFQSVLSHSNVETAIGGWYRIISQGGEPYAQSGAKPGDPLLRDKNKTSGNLRNFLDVQPRTLIGVSDDRVYLVVADGRQSGWSAGLTLNGCGRILYSLGCKKGVNLDGGGSSAIVTKQGNTFKAMNRPSDGVEREVVNSLLVYARE